MAGAVEFFYPPPCGCYLEQMPPETASQPNRWVMIRFCDMHAALLHLERQLGCALAERYSPDEIARFEATISEHHLRVAAVDRLARSLSTAA